MTRPLLFAACLIFFLERGPYRALRYSTTGDFSTVYAAARCWLHHQNPYRTEVLKAELVQAQAPPAIIRDQDLNPSVYLPSAMPLLAPFALFPWPVANLLWCLLQLTALAWSGWVLLEQTAWSTHTRWLAACGLLLFSPSYVGIYNGNPSVFVISCLILACCYRDRPLLSGLCLGFALAFKPQLAVCGLCALALWNYRKNILFSALLFVALLLPGAAIAPGGSFQIEKQNLSASRRPNATGDLSPSSPFAWQMLNTQALLSYLTPQPYFVWLAVTLLFLLRRRRSFWEDAALLSTFTLMAFYHRYYDAQLLWLLLPSLSLTLVPAICLLVLAFPIQTVFAHALGPAATIPSIKQFLLLRNQPLAVLALAIFSTLQSRALPNSCNTAGQSDADHRRTHDPDAPHT